MIAEREYLMCSLLFDSVFRISTTAKCEEYRTLSQTQQESQNENYTVVDFCSWFSRKFEVEILDIFFQKEVTLMVGGIEILGRVQFNLYKS